MLIPLTDLQIIYEKVLEELNLSYTSVLIFVAFDTDSVCTLKILTGILKSQSILYEVYPVATYLDLEEKIQTAKAIEKVKMIFFINCGGAIDLTQKWFYQERQKDEIQVFLLDVHKPIHHANISHRNIKVVDDGLSNLSKCPTKNDIIKLVELENNELQSESQQEEFMQFKQQPQQGDDEVSPLKRKREIKKRLQLQRKQIKSSINKKIQEYYGKQYSGLPSSFIALRLARDINKITNEYLWLGMIGLTSLLLESKISKDEYNKAEAFFSSQALKKNIANARKSGQQIGSISKEIDFRFALLRHWSLYNSIKYSPYMVVKLKLWDDFGINKMNDFITQIGVSLEDAKQLHCYLSTKSFNDMKLQLFKKAEDFELYDITFNSFKKQIDTYETFTCSDYFEAITAALEDGQPQGLTEDKRYELKRDNFWTAYHLLDQGRIEDIKHFIESQKTFMKILVTQALSIIQKNQINPCLDFIYVKYINNTPERQLFEHPSRLIKLGKLIMQLYHEKKRSKNKAMKPLIISIESQDHPNCTIAGIVPDTQNFFGTKFINHAEKNNFSKRHDGFESNIIEIKKDDLIKFIGELNLS